VASNNLAYWYDVNKYNIANQMAVEDANANRLQAALTNNAEWANNRASEIGRYDYETQRDNAANAINLLELQQQAAMADNANAWNYFNGLYSAGAADIADERARAEYLAQAENQAKLAYWEALNRANEVNAAGQFDAAQYNNSLQTQLMQLALQYAAQLQGMEDSGRGGGVAPVDNSGVEQTPTYNVPKTTTATNRTASKVVKSDETRQYNASAPATRSYNKMVPMTK
jgi:hypothetical protein